VVPLSCIRDWSPNAYNNAQLYRIIDYRARDSHHVLQKRETAGGAVEILGQVDLAGMTSYAAKSRY